MQVDTRVDVFQEIFLVFLGLGTLIGVLVVAYTLYNAYKYRDESGNGNNEDPLTLGELPTGGGSGKKLFVSFFLSAIVVISLIVWGYGLLLYVEDGPDQLDEDAIEVDVEGFTFGFSYTYDNGIEQSGTFVVPQGEPVAINVTATDVWHTFGISQERVKADAIPGEYHVTWFAADSEPGTYENAIECFELCGPGHSDMQNDLVILSPDEFDAWVDEQLDLHVTVLDGDYDEEADEAAEPFAGDFDGEVVHEETGDTFAFDQTDLDDEGTVTIGDIDQGGDLTITVEPADDAYDAYEGDLSHTGADGGETYEIELQPVEDNDENDDDGEN